MHRDFTMILTLLDLEEYLPPATLAWCQHTYHALGFTDPPVSADFIHNHRHRVPNYFLAFLTAIRDHYHQGNQNPILGQLEKPTAGYEWPHAAAVLQDWRSGIDTAGLVEEGLLVAEDS
jgi:hypothetical protein